MRREGRNKDEKENEKLTGQRIERIPYLIKQEKMVLGGKGNLGFHELIY